MVCLILNNLVLIVPLWNWNRRALRPAARISGFNRTFMELKYRIQFRDNKVSRVLIVPLWNWNLTDISLATYQDSFNRTFMELKCSTIARLSLHDDSFNRTFMELKCINDRWLRVNKSVLIVPLWNWNDLCRACTAPEVCFNRTFMELKYLKLAYDFSAKTRFNRTFMELKYQSGFTAQ